MTELELEQAILDYIQTTYNACYIGLLRVDKTDSIYLLTIGIPSYMFPTVIGGSFNNDDEFLTYIYEEIRTRNYMRVEFYKVYRTPSVGEEGPTSDQVEQDTPNCDSRANNTFTIY